MQQRLPKSIRKPEAVAHRQLTDRSLDLIETIARYRFLPTALLLRLTAGGRGITAGHLKVLFHRGLVSRFQLKRNGEYIYYLDNLDAVRMLFEGSQAPGQLIEEVTNNREKDYTGAVGRGEYGRLLFISHELVISHFHGLIELACKNSGGQVQLEQWHQGSELFQSVTVSGLKFDNETKGWELTAGVQRLPHRPDAFFALRFPGRPQENQLAHFFYEADRGTMPITDMKLKLRAHWNYVVQQKLHRQHYGIPSIRAVLIETTDEARGKRLMEAAADPIVSGSPRASKLFWFTISPMLENLDEPEAILERIWALATDLSMHSLEDENNY